MIDELVVKVSAHNIMNLVLTLTKGHFFRTQLTRGNISAMGRIRKRYMDMRTLAMDPHKQSLRFPFFENIALCKPRGCAMVMRFASDILIYPRI